MQKKILVLGGGMVGSTIAIDLSKQYDVSVVDLDQNKLNKLNRVFGIHCLNQDVMDRKTFPETISNYDLIIGAIPGEIGYNVMKRIIDAGKDMVNISFFPEDPFELNEKAKSKGVSIAIDCGMAPGISNMILGYHHKSMQVDRFSCMVGGLPRERDWPWEYKAVFSPSDVIAEYIRPARYIENGKLITKQALSDAELVNFEGIGTLEAWNSDGLRTLLKTAKVPNMIEKTLRYPGTIEYLKVLRESGFFSSTPIEINDVKIRPIDFTTKILTPKWELKKGEEDFTVLKALVVGKSEGKELAYEYNLFDSFDQKTGTHSMSRCSGFACSAVAEILLDGNQKHGIITPESLAEKEGLFSRIITYMQDRGVSITVDRLY